jgi:hypothetical protein
MTECLKRLSFLSFFPLLFILGCQVKSGGGGTEGGGLISGHVPVDNQFTLTTTMNATYVTGNTIFFNLNFPKPVTVAGGTPSFTIRIGATDRQATFAGGNGTRNLTFSYTVVAGDSDSDGIQVVSNMNLNGATMRFDGDQDCSTIISAPNLNNVRVNPVADTAPVANNLTPPAFDEDTQSIITLSYTDAESHLATSCTLSSLTNVAITQACACAAGVCTVGVTGTLNYFGAAGFQYRVTANGLQSNLATAAFTINPVDDAPVASNITPPDFLRNTESIITLSYTDVENDQATSCSLSGLTNVTITQACACAAGVCTVGVTGTLNYTGSAGFQYTVTANALVSNTATATFNITNGNPPVATNITPPAFDEDVQGVITLAYTDADGDQASACAVSAETNITVTQACACVAGVCTVGVTGSPLHYNGAASFNFTVTANGDTSNTASATLTINPVDDAPVASNITPPAFVKNAQSIITLSYTDVENDQATVCTISNLSNVTVTQACACAAGVCTVGVTGTTGYSGAASFDYTVTANGLESNVATASLTISNGNPPVANNITPPAFDEDVQSIITLSYTDDENDQASSCSIAGLTNVTVTQACACAAGVCTVGVTGSPLNYNGAASFTYTVTADGDQSNSATATLTINPVDDAPVANNITPPAFDENTQSVITLSYSDVEGDFASSCSISNISNVTVTQVCSCVMGTCTVGVTGTLNYSGLASFDYTVTANGLVSNTATASLTINDVDYPPVANNITPPAFNEDTQSIITLSYTDEDGDLATSCSLSSLTNVTVTQACACAAGTCTVGVTGSPLHYNGPASFSYTVTANGLTSNSASATLTITPVDDAPVADDISPPAFNEDVQGIITLAYSDPENDNATSCSVANLTNVTVTQACACAAGVCTVGVTGSPLHYNGPASFTYTVTANGLTSNSATASLTITPVDDAPVANNITPPAFDKNAQSIITLSYTDPDGDQATSCSTSALSNVTVTQACACAAGVCTVGVTGTLNYHGAASFSYTVTANGVQSNSASASLTINNVNSPPTMSAIGTQTTQRNTATGSIAFTIADPDSTVACNSTYLSMSSSNTSIVQNSSVSWGGSGGNCTAVITPVTNAWGSVTITFTVSDLAGGTAQRSFTLDVTHVVLQWQYTNGTPVSSHSFGTPGANTSVDVLVKNIGNRTSGTVTVTKLAGGNARITHTGTCTTIPAGGDCPITINWDNAASPGFREATFRATETHNTIDLYVSGTK